MKLTRRELNFELRFVTEVLKLKSLHYGYWEQGTATGKINLDELRSAQARFTERLLDLIPNGVRTILDVGAGIGDNARALASRGYRVTSLSPDRNHARYFAAMTEPNIAFHTSSFESFDTEERFDLLLFSESLNYIDPRIGLQQSRRFVRPGGCLLISGIFRHPGEQAFPRDFDLAELDYIRLAKRSGFVPSSIVDITPNVLPTLVIIHRALRDYAPALLDFADSYMRARAPLKSALMNFFLRRERRTLERRLAKYTSRTDPDSFRERVRYVTVVLKDTQASHTAVATPSPARAAPEQPRDILQA